MILWLISVFQESMISYALIMQIFGRKKEKLTQMQLLTYQNLHKSSEVLIRH